nr:hypothetical protein [Halomicronema hongdechloris]
MNSALPTDSGEFTGLVSTLIILLLVATAVALVTRQLRIPYVVRVIDRPLPLRWQHVLIMGNVKGSLAMALAVSLPLSKTAAHPTNESGAS